MVENYGEAGSCILYNDGYAFEVVIGWGKGEMEGVEGLGTEWVWANRGRVIGIE